MSRRTLSLATAALIVAVMVGIGLVVSGGGPVMRVTAYFPRTTGVYQDSTVRILGVVVGKVTKITPMGPQVRVDMEYDARYKVPITADAVIVPPSIVSDRYIQLAPAYSSGPVMPDRYSIPENRTEVPLELDQIFADLDTLNRALGPQGANRAGALSRLVDVSAANLDGNGTVFNTALHDLSLAVSTLSGGRNDLFATVSNLQQFTTTLANDDGGVRAVSADLAQVSVQLNGERSDLAAALSNLATALGLVGQFVHDNRATLTADVSSLTSVTSGILTEKRALIEFLDVAPLALSDLALTYDPATHNLRTRNNSGGTSSNPGNPTNPICQLLNSLGQPCLASAPLVAAGPTASASDSLFQLFGMSP